MINNERNDWYLKEIIVEQRFFCFEGSNNGREMLCNVNFKTI